MGEILVLSERDVQSLVSPLEAQRAVEEAFRDFANGVSRMAARVTVPIPGIAGNLRILPAVKVLPVPRPIPPTRGYLGVKVYSGYVGPVFKDLSKDRFTVLLYGMQTGELLSIVAARYLGALRTGATAAVATKFMAREDSRTVCVIGTGEQAETQVTNLQALLEPERILAFSRNSARRDAFASRMIESGVRVEVVDDAETAVRQSDVISLATTSREPVIHMDWVQPGSHVNAVGANLANRREVDSDLIGASRLVVEYREQALAEAGDLVVPIERGELSPQHIAAELGELITGSQPGRTSAREITMFKSIGVAIEDVAVAAFAYEKAVSRKVGTAVTM